MSVKYNRNLLPLARKLRDEMTKQEKQLWYGFLRMHQRKFYKQKIIGNFIADFYCHVARLVVEVDGSQHYTEKGLADDYERTKILNYMNIKVIRFTNREVNENFVAVCQMIDREMPSPSPTEPPLPE